MPHVLAFCLGEIPSATVGVVSFLQYLQDNGRLHYTFKVSHLVNVYDIANADVIICVRGSAALEMKILRLAQKYGKYVIYYLDDDLFNLPTYSSSFAYVNERIKTNMQTMMRSAHILWTPNHNIAIRYANYLKKVACLKAPTLFYETQISYSECKDSPISIVFAGSEDHRFFIDEIMGSCVEKLLAEFGERIRFYLIGAKPDIVRKYPQIRHIPYQDDFQKYRQTITELHIDIGLAPLQDSSFHCCKYYNKFLEYGALKICGIYSNVEPYTLVVRNDVNGKLAENTWQDWFNSIVELINNTTLRRQIADTAYKQVIDEYNMDILVKELTSRIPELTMFRAKRRQIRLVDRLMLQYRRSIVFRLLEGLRVHKFKYLPHLAKRLLQLMKKREQTND